MSKEKVIKIDNEIEKRIKAEIRRVKPLFANLTEDKIKFADKVICQFATTQIILERLADEINNNDILENFEQGLQKFKRENPALKAYNSTIKSYTTLAKQLIDLLPDKRESKAGQDIMTFITQPKIINR